MKLVFSLILCLGIYLISCNIKKNELPVYDYSETDSLKKEIIFKKDTISLYELNKINLIYSSDIAIDFFYNKNLCDNNVSSFACYNCYSTYEYYYSKYKKEKVDSNFKANDSLIMYYYLLKSAELNNTIPL